MYEDVHAGIGEDFSSLMSRHLLEVCSVRFEASVFCCSRGGTKMLRLVRMETRKCVHTLLIIESETVPCSLFSC